MRLETARADTQKRIQGTVSYTRRNVGIPEPFAGAQDRLFDGAQGRLVSASPPENWENDPRSASALQRTRGDGQRRATVGTQSRETRATG